MHITIWYSYVYYHYYVCGICIYVCVCMYVYVLVCIYTYAYNHMVLICLLLLYVYGICMHIYIYIYIQCAGIEGELKTALHLASPEKFHYLNQSGVYELLDTDGKPLCDEKLEFARTQQSMTQMRIDPETQDQVWEVLVAYSEHVCVCIYLYLCIEREAFERCWHAYTYTYTRINAYTHTCTPGQHHLPKLDQTNP
jgi:hypothetical protein